MLVESGFVRASVDGGREFTFRPSFDRIASLGSPHEIVQVFAALHGPHAEKEAAYVLACLCDQDDATDLIGWIDDDGPHAGLMPAGEQIIIARHLMQHGIVGKARPGKGDGSFSESFEAAQYIAAARVHLGLSSADAEALSMTEFQTMFEMKFPHAQRSSDLPTREEYRTARAAYMKHREANHG